VRQPRRARLSSFPRFAWERVRVGHRSGFSLIEVLLALAILLMSIVAISQLVGIGSDRALDARLTMRATRLAESKMTEIEVGAVSLDTAGSGGQFPGDDSAWSWSCELQPFGPPSHYSVVVKVTRDVRGTPYEFSLARFLVDPKVMGSAAQAEVPPDTSSDMTGTGGASP
jgi:general secretion pathway protein I